jgi:putative spermidine/putrescine transport system substrate-binding protein
VITTRAIVGVAAAAALAVGLSACAGSDTPAPSDVDAATATSAEDFGGLDALIAAAQAEGELNVIALPDNWANYGEIKALFEEKYDIIVNSADPDISSAEEIAAADNLRGQDTAPDVFDLGTAVTLDSLDYFAPYQVVNWDEIPEANKEATGLWVNDYTGSMAIGYNSRISSATTTGARSPSTATRRRRARPSPRWASPRCRTAATWTTSRPGSTSSRSSTTRATSCRST